MVSEELEILESYLELMRLRFGDSLVIDINLHEKHLYYYIAPLTFQMLIENAVKHNIVEHDRPLRVEIFSETDHIVIRNNLQKKMLSQSSSQIGLNNISSRYLFLTDSDIIVEEDGQYFTVKIPLLKKPYESSNS